MQLAEKPTRRKKTSLSGVCSKMKILIDLTQIPKNKGGVGVYAHNLIHHLALIDQQNKYFLLIQDDEVCFDDLIGKNIHFIRLDHRIFRRFICRIMMEQILIPILIKLYRIDIVHSLHYSFPFLSSHARVVVTIHDMTFFLYPYYHLWVKQTYFKFFIRKLVKWADAIIAVSESTRNDFLRFTKVSPKKVKVIALGRPTAAERAVVEKSDSHSVIDRLGVAQPYILYVGTLEPRKNISRLINVFNRLNKKWPQLSLAIAGAKGWACDPIFKTVETLQLQTKVVFLGFVSDVEKYCLMVNSTVFVYPSMYEGFGLPVLEAMSFGVATITSNRSSMPEVAGQAAILIDPDDESQLYDGLILLLTDQELRKSIGKSAKERSANFRWLKTAQSTLSLYKTLHKS